MIDQVFTIVGASIYIGLGTYLLFTRHGTQVSNNYIAGLVCLSIALIILS